MHNPLRSEAEMFRVVVIVGIAALPVIVVGLLTEPVFAAIVLGIEIGIGIGVLLRTLRGSEPHTTDIATADDDAGDLEAEGSGVSGTEDGRSAA